MLILSQVTTQKRFSNSIPARIQQLVPVMGHGRTRRIAPRVQAPPGKKYLTLVRLLEFEE
jgi:hypothetical protein